MDSLQYIRFWPFLQAIPDPRGRKGRRYRWPFLLGILCAGLLGGQPTVWAIAHWAQLHETELLRALPHRHGRIPSPSTLYRVLRHVSLPALEAQIRDFGEAVDASDPIPGQVIGLDGHAYRGQALDGKEIRGAKAHGADCHLLSLVRHGSGTILGQCQVAAKTNEIPLSRALMARRDLKGTVTTTDALLSQRKLARKVGRQGGHYLMEIKTNQPTLWQALEDWFGAPPWPPDQEERERCVSESYAHGRQEWRELTTSTALNAYVAWPGVQQVMRRVCRRYRQGQCVSEEIHYGVTSLSREQMGPEGLEALWRGHWTIENRLHYVRDETMREDRGQLHVGQAPQALAALRNAILTTLKDHGWTNIAAALRHYQARLQDGLNLLGVPAT